MWQKLRAWWTWLWCRHQEWYIPAKPKVQASPGSNLISSDGASTDSIRSDFFWMLAAFRGFTDAKDTPMFGSELAPGEQWAPIVCVHCEMLRFVRVDKAGL